MVRTEGLTKVFAGPTKGSTITAVEDLTLEVNEGEVFGFLGPNGAGKTTTVRMLTCLVGPTRGVATIQGREVGKDDSAIRGMVGILTETPGLYERLTAEKNLTIFGKLYGVKDVPGQVEKYLRMLGLWERRYDQAGTFSKGMRQKLAIARALVHEPKVLFLDEPTSGLDPEAAKLIRDFIEELRKQGRTIFLCTHNLDEADRLCDRIGIFKNRLLTVDTVDALRNRVFGRKVVFHLEQVDASLVMKIKGLAYVKEAVIVGSKIVVTLDDPERRNPDLVKLIVESGGRVQFVGELRHSMEDIYLQFMKQSSQATSDHAENATGGAA